MRTLTQRLLQIGAIVCAVSALASSPGQCSAQGALSVDRSGCANTWADGIERFVAIELGAVPNDSPDPRALDISVRCEGDEIEIEASQRGAASTRRSMDLSSTASAVRSRVVALAIAGLVRELAVIARSTAHAMPERAAQSAPPVAPVSVGAPEPDAQTRSSRMLQLDPFVAASTFTASPGLLWGGGLRARALMFAPLYVALDAQLGTYARESELGSARLVAGSAGARIGWTGSWRRSAISAGVGQRIGFARASASAERSGATGSSVVGPWTGPFAFAVLETALSSRVRIGIDGELGIVLLPVRGRIETDGDIAVAEAWAALSAALGVQF